MTTTILSTKTALINGKLSTVETIKGAGRQQITYSVDGQPMGFNEFWELEPSFTAREEAPVKVMDSDAALRGFRRALGI